MPGKIIKKMKNVKSCGIILFSRADSEPKFLLMRHSERWDIPKGHIKNGESELECALREFTEETGIAPANIVIDDNFRFSYIYFPKYKKFNYETVRKTLVVFLAYLKFPQNIEPTEHIGYEWFRWAPPHNIQKRAIDPLLAYIEEYMKIK